MPPVHRAAPGVFGSVPGIKPQLHKGLFPQIGLLCPELAGNLTQTVNNPDSDLESLRFERRPEVMISGCARGFVAGDVS
jgi:hypothetical protein